MRRGLFTPHCVTNLQPAGKIGRDAVITRFPVELALATLVTVSFATILYDAVSPMFGVRHSYLSLLGTDMPLQTIYHMTIHSVSLCLSLLLLAISSTAFLRDRRSGLLYLTGAFALILVREMTELGRLALFSAELTLLGSTIEVGHILDLVIVSLFSLGTLRR